MTKLKYSLRRVSFREAFLFAVLLHIILLIAIQVDPIAILPAHKQAEAKSLQDQEPIKFTFVDVPDDKPSPVRPETDRFSDKNRMARGKAPEITSEDKSRLPYSEGTTKEFTLGTPPPGGKKETTQPSPEDKVESSGEEQSPLSAEHLSGDKFLVEPLEEVKPDVGKSSTEAKQKSLRESLMNLDKYIDSQSYDNSESGFSSDGTLSFDTKDFDFGPYGALLYRIVKSNWIVPYAATHLGLKGVTVISFRIQKNGRVTNLTLEDSSGIRPLDGAALNAIELSNPLPPLPKHFPNDSVGVRFGFFYNVVPPDR